MEIKISCVSIYRAFQHIQLVFEPTARLPVSRSVRIKGRSILKQRKYLGLINKCLAYITLPPYNSSRCSVGQKAICTPPRRVIGYICMQFFSVCEQLTNDLRLML